MEYCFEGHVCEDSSPNLENFAKCVEIIKAQMKKLGQSQEKSPAVVALNELVQQVNIAPAPPPPPPPPALETSPLSTPLPLSAKSESTTSLSISAKKRVDKESNEAVRQKEHKPSFLQELQMASKYVLI